MSGAPDDLSGLHALAGAAGLLVDWHDAHGQPQRVAAATLHAVLDALDLPSRSVGEVEDSLARLRAEHDSADPPPLIVAQTGEPVMLGRWAAGHVGQPYRIDLEGGGEAQGRLGTADRPGPWLAPIERIGYHRLEVGLARVTLAVAPQRCYGVADALAGRREPFLVAGDGAVHEGAADDGAATGGMADGGPAEGRATTPLLAGRRPWALAAQLYALRREGDGGLGDFTALAGLAEAAARRGAAALAISPVHAMFAADPGRCSPYGPSSRLFLNALHADPAAVLGAGAVREAVAGLASGGSEAIAGAASPPAEAVPDLIARLEAADRLDWPSVSRVRWALLRRLYRSAAFRDSATLQTDFAAFRREGGEALEDHACFEALHARFAAERPGHFGGWRSWPAEFRDPRSPAVQAYAEAQAEEVGFHAFAQWLAGRGLAEAQRRARAAGMPIGLIADLAVGADGDGSQGWSRQREMLIGLSVGAPPDVLNVHGQSWGLAAFSPRALARHGYGAWIEMLRAAFRHAGGVRIDHVLGLARLWLVPHGMQATEGAYLRLPIDELLGLVALESWRARAIVIGEDLGTVPADFPARLAAAGVLGMQVLWFQREGERFTTPGRWRADTVALTGTHDLPTVAGWWRGRDIDWRARLGLLPPGMSEADERAQRERDRASLWQALRDAGRVPDEAPQPPPDAPPIAQVLAFVAMSPAPLAIVPLEDVCGLVEQPNLPGTTADHPNWLQRLGLGVDRLLEAPGVEARLAALAQGRGEAAAAPTPVASAASTAATAPTASDAPHARDASDAPAAPAAPNAPNEPNEPNEPKAPDASASADGRARPAVPAAPRATVRLQLHAGFTLDDAAQQVDYFHHLGISHLYVSPLTTSRAGSTHGYDVVDPNRIDPEIGGSDALRRLVARLREHGMGLVADIVPNHMGVASPENAWWQDVLAWGPASRHAQWFDIDWEPDDRALHGKLLAPYLGQPYGDTLAEGTLQLRFDAQRGRFHCAYHDHRFPIASTSYADVLAAPAPHPASPQRGEEHSLPGAADGLLPPPAGEARGGGLPASLIERFVRIAPEPTAANLAAWESACKALGDHAASDTGRAAIDAVLQAHSPATDDGRERLHSLLERQHYRLAWWRCAADQINWRRFFEVSDLAGLRVEREDVFEASHALIFSLYAQGLIDGLRVDHIDGLADPAGYCLALRRRLAVLQPGRPPGLREGRPYVVVEKILAVGEALPADWQTDGTSGYDFMDQAGALLHDPAGAEPLGALWREFSGRTDDFAEEALHARRQILAENLAAEREACARAFHRVARESLHTRDWALTSIRRVLTELLVHFPVYRSYPGGPGGRSQADRRHLAHAAVGARGALRSADHALLEQLSRWLNEAPATELQRRALTRFEQLSAPLTAKSVEDTAFYRYGRLLSRNEVGSDPGRFAIGTDEFHRLGAERAAHCPAALLATATHDHKRGEDLRARLAVLSELPGEWAVTVRHWRERNAPARQTLVFGGEAPGGAQELMLYQMLVGAWPLGLAASDREGLAAFAERIAAWQVKALREAKQRTGWTAPDEAFESACRRFLFAILGLEDAAPASDEFVATLAGFVERIAAAGAVNGLAQTLLRLTVPGVPDLYQGCEGWDFSLVDPDNRAPVDYAARRAALTRLDGTDPAALCDGWRDGRLKQALIQRALRLRTGDPALFAAGGYLPLPVEGAQAGHAIAHARRQAGKWLVAVASLRVAGLLPAGSPPHVPPEAWADTAVVLPAGLDPAGLSDVLTGRAVGGSDRRLSLAGLLRDWPVALLAPQRG